MSFQLARLPRKVFDVPVPKPEDSIWPGPDDVFDPESIEIVDPWDPQATEGKTSIVILASTLGRYHPEVYNEWRACQRMTALVKTIKEARAAGVPYNTDDVQLYVDHTAEYEELLASSGKKQKRSTGSTRSRAKKASTSSKMVLSTRVTRSAAKAVAKKPKKGRK
ncbi:hypothetical protein EXIGLDRAFT_843086 [Exidia glandulosa HHB12029]|uniref:Uncharacterized protein n=1 Tax=Exidia glandulosa HHB12029 TaxID=1314781 RepID=A0A165CWF3_EXIGL|nr:hypothetical protein EXIGLDRAFT_843086 [Exidia glandulosa HHB12029]